MRLMAEDSRFLRESVVDIDAAVVGISSTRWTSIPCSEATPEHAAELMGKNRFDLLPIETEGGIKEYFQTQKWGDFSSASRRSIGYNDVIPCSTPLRNVIQAFAADSRTFYFLASDRSISGLISVVNLNCRQVKVYLFSLLCELEIQLGTLINRELTNNGGNESELLEMTFGGNENPKYREIKERYESDKAKGVEVPLVEYLYLPDLFKVIHKKRLFGAFRLESAGQFDDAFNPLVELRNNVNHPNRSLISDPASCKRLWARINQIESALFDLRER